MQLSEFEFGLAPYPWQANIWQQLSEQLHAGKLPHALMMSGPAGVGKARLALVLAHRLLCTAPLSEMACGNCKACLLMTAGTHPDLLLLEPEEPGKAIRIDKIRQTNDFLAKTAQQGGRKVVVLAPAEAMNTAAANALLKSLEEPSGDSYLVLVSHLMGSVLSTIRSRCRLQPLPQPPEALVLPWLSPLVGNRADPRVLLRLANGAPLTAHALLDGDNLEQYTLLTQSLEAIALGQASPLDVAAQWLVQDYRQILSWLQNWLTELLRLLQWQVEPASAKDFAVFTGLLQHSGFHLLHKYYEKVARARAALDSGSNPNAQLLLEEVTLDWQAVIRASQRQRR